LFVFIRNWRTIAVVENQFTKQICKGLTVIYLGFKVQNVDIFENMIARSNEILNILYYSGLFTVVLLSRTNSSKISESIG